MKRLASETGMCRRLGAWLSSAVWPGCAVAAALLAGACSDAERPETSRPRTEDQQEAGRVPSLEVVPVESDALAQELDAAIAQARRSSAAARLRWMEDDRLGRLGGTMLERSRGTDDEAVRWSVKWAAPVLHGDGAGRVEHVWIRPLQWTPQRIEGVLLSAPRRAIGYDVGDMVGVPATELSDWLREDSGRREGGFTITVLDRWAQRLRPDSP